MIRVDRVWAVYFSPTGTTRKVVTTIAKELAEDWRVDLCEYDFTLPSARKNELSFACTDVVVLGTPVYAGRVPNILLPYLNTLQGNGAIAIPVVLFGNRDYDDALIELRDILINKGFYAMAAGAFVGEHSFSRILASGRPDEDDLKIVNEFVRKIREKGKQLATTSALQPVVVAGTPSPYRGYYMPRDRQGNPIDIRKVKPRTNNLCNNCKQCVDVCPMGSIHPENVREVSGICIKCGACIKKCPQEAKYYDNAGYLYHKHELEEELTRRAENTLFV